MTISEKEYFTKRNNYFHKRQKILATMSLISFSCSVLFAGASTVYKAIQTQPTVSPSYLSLKDSLHQQARNYELVLYREPNNQVVMEKLSILRLKLKDINGSVKLLEILAKQHPERQDYQVLLKQMHQQQAAEKANP